MRDYELEASNLSSDYKWYLPSFQEDTLFDLIEFGDIIYISRKLAGKINMNRVNRFMGDTLAISLALSINTNFELSRFYLFDFNNNIIELGGVRLRFVVDDDIPNNIIAINRDCAQLKLLIII